MTANRYTTAARRPGKGRSLAHLEMIDATTVRKAHCELSAVANKEGDSVKIVADSHSEKNEISNQELSVNKSELSASIAGQICLSEIHSAPEEQSIDSKDNASIQETNIIEKSRITDSSGGTVIKLLGNAFEDSSLSTSGTTTMDKEPVKSNTFDPVLLKSVNCKEFIPMQQLNIDASEFQYSYKDLSDSVVVEQFKPQTTLLRTPNKGEGESFILDLVRNTVRTLTESPGEYDYIINDFAENLKGIKEKTTMTEFVKVLIEQAIAEPNFQYTAVKMADSFATNQTLELSTDIGFKKCLYSRLQSEYRSISGLLKCKSDPKNISRAIGLSMFFGDLLCNMKKEDASLSIVFRKAVFGIIKDLLEQPSEKTINCLIKLLKLTGPTLDKHKIKENIPEVDETFNKIRDLSLDKNWLGDLETGNELRNRLFGVYKLHSRNWDADTNEEKPSTFVPAPVMDRDVESETSDSKIDWNEYYVGDDDESDEMDDAYEQFLKESGQL